VTGAVACFITHLARPDQSTRPITAEFRAIGGAAAREGRTLDALQDALRLGARVAWRWLCEADAIPAGPVRCDQHLSTLLILADEDLAAVLRGRRLAPLARLRPGQRDRIAETLLAWLQLGENAAEVAQRLHVHPQTVRYRMRQIHELFGDQLRDPDRRFELQLALRIRTLSAGRPSEEGRSSLGSATAVADRG
jgi:DNA-binding CsgD family transcriptional regulator